MHLSVIGQTSLARLMGDRRVISDREYAEKYRFGQVGRLTRDYEDALKRVREDDRKAANRLAQAEPKLGEVLVEVMATGVGSHLGCRDG
jgi:hypothetical protein